MNNVERESFLNREQKKYKKAWASYLGDERILQRISEEESREVEDVQYRVVKEETRYRSFYENKAENSCQSELRKEEIGPRVEEEKSPKRESLAYPEPGEMVLYIEELT